MKKKVIIVVIGCLLLFAACGTAGQGDDSSNNDKVSMESSENTNVVNGVDGKDGADGVDGKDGADGVDGKDGADGVDGKDGANGVDGKDGADGVDGKDGADGVDGKDGADGVDGIDGKDGVHGKDGISVVSVLVNENNHLIVTFSNGQVQDAGEITVNEKDSVVDGEEIMVSHTLPINCVTNRYAAGAYENAPVICINNITCRIYNNNERPEIIGGKTQAEKNENLSLSNKYRIEVKLEYDIVEAYGIDVKFKSLYCLYTGNNVFTLDYDDETGMFVGYINVIPDSLTITTLNIE